MDQTNISDPLINPPNQESANTSNNNSQISNNNLGFNTKRTKLFLLTGILSVVVIITLGVYYFSLKSNKDLIKPPVKPTPILEDKTNPEEGKYIIFQDKKVFWGESFNFLPKDDCVGDIKARLDRINPLSVVIVVTEEQGLNRQWYPKELIETGTEKNVPETISDGTCRIAPPLCMDVGYKYCFSLSTMNSVPNLTYELKGKSLMPPPPKQ